MTSARPHSKGDVDGPALPNKQYIHEMLRIVHGGGKYQTLCRCHMNMPPKALVGDAFLWPSLLQDIKS